MASVKRNAYTPPHVYHNSFCEHYGKGCPAHKCPNKCLHPSFSKPRQTDWHAVERGASDYSR